MNFLLNLVKIPIKNYNINCNNITNLTYVILFSGQSNLKKTRILDTKFRHCIVLIKSHNGWKFINPLATGIMTANLDDVEYQSLAQAYDQLGYTVVFGRRQKIKRQPKRRLNCVEVAKFYIGVEKKYIKTPWQLYKYLVVTGRGVKFINDFK